MKKIGFLGGSISKGEGVKFEDCYVSVFEKRINSRKISDDAISIVWRGISGTMSSNGIFCVDELIEKRPELVFIDYAMNDNGDRYLAECFEGIVHRLLKNNIPVVILFFCNEYGRCTRGAMERVGACYHIPVLDIGQMIYSQVQDGTLEWSTYAKDYVHPTEKGHEMIADILSNWLLNAGNEALLEYEKIPEEPAFEGGFLEFEKVFFAEQMKKSNPGDIIFKEKITCRMLMIEFFQNSILNESSIIIEVDGQVISVANAYASMAWGNPVCQYICGDGSLQKYEITIRLGKEKCPLDWDYSQFNFKMLYGK